MGRLIASNPICSLLSLKKLGLSYSLLLLLVAVCFREFILSALGCQRPTNRHFERVEPFGLRVPYSHQYFHVVIETSAGKRMLFHL